MESTGGRLDACHVREASEDGCAPAPEQPTGGGARECGNVVTEEGLLHPSVRARAKRIEFKATEAVAADMARAIVAMANSGGGSILVGVGDDGELLRLRYAYPTHVTRDNRAMLSLAGWRQWVTFRATIVSQRSRSPWNTLQPKGAMLRP